MKIHHADYRKKEFRLEVEHKDDLWYLSHVIDAGDRCSMKTFRKIKIGDDHNASVVRKAVFLTLTVEEIDFHPYSGDLRVSGKILQGTDDVASGQYHTFSIEEGSAITLSKDHLFSYQKDKLEEAKKNNPTNILIATIDRGEAAFAQLKKYGFDMLLTLTGEVEHKRAATAPREPFFKEAVQALFLLIEQKRIARVIIASPSLWTANLSELVAQKKPTVPVSYVVCNSTGSNAVNEVLRTPQVQQALQQERTMREVSAVEELLRAIAQDSSYAYGLDQVKEKALGGAVKTLLVSSTLLQSLRQQGHFSELEEIMQAAEQSRGEILVISSEHDAGKQLESLSGIAALLRY